MRDVVRDEIRRAWKNLYQVGSNRQNWLTTVPYLRSWLFPKGDCQDLSEVYNTETNERKCGIFEVFLQWFPLTRIRDLQYIHILKLWPVEVIVDMTQTWSSGIACSSWQDMHFPLIFITTSSAIQLNTRRRRFDSSCVPQIVHLIITRWLHTPSDDQAPADYGEM